MLRRICKYAAHLRLIRPMELEVALPKAIDKISARRSPTEQQRLYQYVQAVSYTHLDVYKRQCFHRFKSASINGHAFDV